MTDAVTKASLPRPPSWRFHLWRRQEGGGGLLMAPRVRGTGGVSVGIRENEMRSATTDPIRPARVWTSSPVLSNRNRPKNESRKMG